MFRSELTRGRTEHPRGRDKNIDLRHLAIPSFIQPSRKHGAAASITDARTPIHLAGHPQKSALVAEITGEHLRELRTPAFVIDRHVSLKNCARMHANRRIRRSVQGSPQDSQGNRSIRVLSMRLLHVPYLFHIRSLDCGRDKAPTCFLCCYYCYCTHAVVLSMLMKAWEVVKSGLVSDGVIKDVSEDKRPSERDAEIT